MRGVFSNANDVNSLAWASIPSSFQSNTENTNMTHFFKLYLGCFFRSLYLFQVFHMVLCSRENKGLLRWLDQILKNVQQNGWNKEQQSWNDVLTNL